MLEACSMEGSRAAHRNLENFFSKEAASLLRAQDRQGFPKVAAIIALWLAGGSGHAKPSSSPLFPPFAVRQHQLHTGCASSGCS